MTAVCDSTKRTGKRGRGRPPKANAKEPKDSMSAAFSAEKSSCGNKKSSASVTSNENIEYAGLTRFEIPIPFDLNADEGHLLEGKSLNECSMSSFDRFNLNSADECSTNKMPKLDDEHEVHKAEKSGKSGDDFENNNKSALIKSPEVAAREDDDLLGIRD